MAARKLTAQSALVRERIRTTQLLNRLQNYLLGKKDRRTKRELDLKPHQVAGILGLLRKVVPDLQSIEHLGEIEVKHQQVAADPLTPEQWEEKFGGERRAH